MYEYYAEVEEAENQIALYEYGRTDVTYNEAKYLQKMYDVKEILKLYDECKDWQKAIKTYKEKQ